MKLIVAGTRTFNDYPFLKRNLDYYLSGTTESIEIVSGGADGADALGERYAKEKGYPLKQFLADWKNRGRAAGPYRNEEMAQYATHCVVFWDGESRGTLSMINLCKEYGLQLRIVEYTSTKPF